MSHSLKICCGTACYIMGGEELLKIEDILTEDERRDLHVTAVPCINECRNDENLRPPFVVFDGELIDRATVDIIRAKIAASR